MRSLTSLFPQQSVVPSTLRSPKTVGLMCSASSSCSATSSAVRLTVVHPVPSLTADEISAAASEAFARYSSAGVKRSGNGVAIVWFRNDLRLVDNEALRHAWAGSNALLPVYFVDPRHFGSTHLFGFPKTGALRAKFLLECLHDLKKNLKERGLDLLVKYGKPEDILPSIAKAFGAHTVFAHKETCSEELLVEKLVLKGLQQVILPQHERSNPKTVNPRLQLIWGSTMYHIEDLPFDAENLPDVYTQFRKSVESKSSIRECNKLPVSLSPLPSSSLGEVGGWGSVPSLGDLGLEEPKLDKGMHFIGGENAALGRVFEYFWKKVGRSSARYSGVIDCRMLVNCAPHDSSNIACKQDLVRVYKETRNGMLGADYSTKFSPWLASGSLSPRYLYAEVKRYEKARLANDSTYWVLFELIWRDYFRFLSIKYGNSIFHLGGPRKLVTKWSQDTSLFESWKGGHTGYPLIDANMKELSMTGFMSNRGRQIVCSFLVRDMRLDWRLGAEWFESCLLDYDPCSNYGNWTYAAGVGNDPREDRYFSIPKQAKTYDPEGEYVSYWLPELQPLPRERRNFPGKSYIEQVVPLKFENTTIKRQNHFSTDKVWKKKDH